MIVQMDARLNVLDEALAKVRARKKDMENAPKGTTSEAVEAAANAFRKVEAETAVLEAEVEDLAAVAETLMNGTHAIYA